MAHIAIKSMEGDNVFCGSDLSDFKDKGEVAHFYMELQRVSKELLLIWEEINDEEGELNE